MKMSRLTLCINHNDLEKTDLNWAERTIYAAAGRSVPVPPIVVDKTTGSSAIDSFENEETCLDDW